MLHLSAKVSWRVFVIFRKTINSGCYYVLNEFHDIYLRGQGGGGKG